jgi:hypothetical protein
MMRIALCLFGQPRTYRFCSPSLHKHIIDKYNPKIFICSDGDEKGLREVYNPTTIETISWDEQYRRIGDRIYRYGETFPTPNRYYPQYPYHPANDLLPLFKMQCCREMVRNYEEKYGEFDVIIYTRFDAKFLSVQPIENIKKNTFYIPRVDAFGKAADPDGTFWEIGYCSHIWWADSETASKISSAFYWIDDVYRETRRWCGEAMIKYYCDKMKINVKHVNVDFMLIRGTSQEPREALPPWDLLSKSCHPEYLPKSWEKISPLSSLDRSQSKSTPSENAPW